MWNEGFFIQTKDEQLHPYVEWCGCNTLNFPAMEKILGLTYISFGTEIAYKEADLIPDHPYYTGCHRHRHQRQTHGPDENGSTLAGTRRDIRPNQGNLDQIQRQG
jgi:hypothetical protein